MTDNLREGNPNLYTRPSWYHYIIPRPRGHERCGYCFQEFPEYELHAFSVTTNGKKRDLWRCEKCREDMKSYKATDI